MDNRYLLPSAHGQTLYSEIKDLPIYDYHCHLSPKEIYEDKPFTNIGELWLGGDHYKWRLMRAMGVDEELVTGQGSWHDKFVAFAKVIEYAAGSPLYHWTKMELETYFSITTPLTSETAEEIWAKANQVIEEKQLSPRKLISSSRVAFIGTTDDVADTLEWHQKLAGENLPYAVKPSFRCDTLLLIREAGYASYIHRLENVAGMKITNLSELDQALEARLDAFVSLGCVFSDLGIQDFPSRVASDKEADKTFRLALAGKPITDEAYSGWLGNRMCYLAKAYKARHIIMQLHLCVLRNANQSLFERCGRDVGGDSIGDELPARAVTGLLSHMAVSGGLPTTILYALNPAMSAKLAVIAGCFRGVYTGAAWWFCDHKRGIREQMETLAEVGHLATFPGMLTDSRSFLSYARHDYFRRILCQMLGEWVESGELEPNASSYLAKHLACGRMKEMIEAVECQRK